MQQVFGHSRKRAHKEIPTPESYGEVVAEFTGSWLSHLDFDGDRFWTLNQCKSFDIIPTDNPLPSDSRFRRDLLLLKEGKGFSCNVTATCFHLRNNHATGDLKGSQKAKVELEEKQRKDAKARHHKYDHA